MDAEALHDHVKVLKLRPVIPITSPGGSGVDVGNEDGHWQVGEKRRRRGSGKLGRKGKRVRGGGEDMDMESTVTGGSALTMVPRLSIHVRGDVAVEAEADGVVIVEVDMEHNEFREHHSGSEEEVEQEVEAASDNDEHTSLPPINDDTPHDVMKDIIEKQHLQLTSLTRELKDLKKGHSVSAEHYQALLRPLQEFRASSSSSIDGVPRKVEARIEEPWEMGLPQIEQYTRETIEAARASAFSDANIQNTRAEQGLQTTCRSQASQTESKEAQQQPLDQKVADEIRATCAAFEGGVSKEVQKALCGTVQRMRVGWMEELVDVSQHGKLEKIREGYGEQIQEAQGRMRRRMCFFRSIDFNLLIPVLFETHRYRHAHRGKRESKNRTRGEICSQYVSVSLFFTLRPSLIFRVTEREEDKREMAIHTEHQVNELKEQFQREKEDMLNKTITTTNNNNNTENCKRASSPAFPCTQLSKSPACINHDKYYADFTFKTHLHILHASSFLDPLKSHQDEEVRRYSGMAARVLGEAAGGYVKCMKSGGDTMHGLVPFVSFEGFVDGLRGEGSEGGARGGG